MGLEAASGERVPGSELVEVEASTVSLIHQGGVRVAVTENDGPSLEGGKDEISYVLTTIREEQEQLGFGDDVVAVEENISDRGTDGTGPWFSSDENFVSFCLKSWR